MKNIFNHIITYCLFVLISVAFVFLFSCTTSPLYERYPFWFHGDSGIFQEMGVCILHGGVPYVDLFDHKGPVLWFIQALGLWISPKWGLAMLQSISLYATIILWYKTIEFFVEKWYVTVLILCTGLFFLMCFYLRGNLCEEWSLPFISWPIYIYLKRYKGNSSFNLTDVFIIGLCIGVLALIRMNNMAPFLGFVLWIYIILIKESKWSEAIYSALVMIAGAVAIFVPCILFYYFKAGWYGVQEMLFGTFGFNFSYIAWEENKSIIQWIQYHIPMFGVLLITILCINRSNLNITIPALISYLVTCVSFGNRMYYHYLMIFIPLIIVTMCVLYQSSSKIAFTILGIVLLQSFTEGYCALDCLAHRLLENPVNTEQNDGFHRFVSSMPQEERRSIYNDGLNHMGAGLFADENIYQCNRFLTRRHYESVLRFKEYKETHGINEMQPIWVFTQSPTPQTSDEYLINHYILADSIPGGVFDPIWCWKRVH